MSVHIDGFNFYYGAVRKTDYKWLDLKLLCQTILKPYHQITLLKYFTAKVRPNLIVATCASFPRLDATSFVLMKKHDIKSAFSLDYHFASVGFRLLG